MKQVWEVKDNANAYFKYLVISSVRYYEPCAASRSNPRPARQLYYAGEIASSSFLLIAMIADYFRHCNDEEVVIKSNWKSLQRSTCYKLLPELVYLIDPTRSARIYRCDSVLRSILHISRFAGLPAEVFF